MLPTAEMLPSPDPSVLGGFLLCLVALMGVAVLALQLALQTRKLFFSKEPDDDKRPITNKEFREEIFKMRCEMQATEARLLKVMEAPNLKYVTQEQFEDKLDRLKTEIHSKIDAGGRYTHEAQHEMNQVLQIVRIDLARLIENAGLQSESTPLPRPVRRGPMDMTRGEHP